MNTGDASYIKQLNRRILIQEIIKNKSLSRSNLARITGLNKATVSAQIQELIDNKLVVETNETALMTRGRKPILLEMNANAGYSVGIDIDEKHIRVIFIDLKGKPFSKVSFPVESQDLFKEKDKLIDKLFHYVKKFNEAYQPIGLTGIGIGIHGIVDNTHQIVFTPKQQWTNINIKEDLEETFQTNVLVDNNANLSVFAEQVYDEQISDLFCITLYSGIGLGIIQRNKIYRGYEGFAGEIGHMIVHPDGIPCTCGNHGCWERYASEKSLLEKLYENIPEHVKTKEVLAMLREDEHQETVDEFLRYLAIGLNNVINIFNPEKVIMNGTIINKSPQLLKQLEGKLSSKFNNYHQIRPSRIGSDACALGGAASALRKYLGIDSLNFVQYDYFDSDLVEA
ncbi:ROK family transcriptional regulator [Virgibacillus siamensis]|uniref:ROK family transcriptional regulator n=1 Tax=Virgibacillus siamensis TaxID=480071 RepID=UPI000984E7CA|nr:ROK family transcriptional regulator [Virgibacillus siamensis]